MIQKTIVRQLWNIEKDIEFYSHNIDIPIKSILLQLELSD